MTPPQFARGGKCVKIGRMKEFFVLMLLAGRAGAASAPSQALMIQNSFRKVVSGIRPAVVSIDSVFTRPEPHGRRFMGIGSGVITDPRGYILTNEHVVGGAEEIKVIVKDPEEKVYRGRIVGTDSTTDLAVVKIEPRKTPYPYASLGNSDKVQVGDWAIAVGSPFGLEQTVTVGVISALRQSIKVGLRDYSDFFQTDAAINEGNSGGPLLDIQGQVIGVNTAIFSPTGVFGGVSFAIPSNQAARIMKELIDKGRVIRGWVGVEISPLSLPGKKGALILAALPDSPAAKADLRQGDVIVEFAGRTVASAASFIRMVELTPPGNKIPMRLIRGDRPQGLTIAIEERPAVLAAAGERPRPIVHESEIALWEGAHLQTADASQNKRFRLPDDATGVIVIDVEKESMASAIGLQAGDLIIAINAQQVRNAPAFIKTAQDSSMLSGVVLYVKRQGQPLYWSLRKSR